MKLYENIQTPRGRVLIKQADLRRIRKLAEKAGFLDELKALNVKVEHSFDLDLVTKDG